MLAVENGYESIVELLLDKGAQTEAQNNIRLTALLIAADKGLTRIVKLLLDKDANTEAHV